jgi:hypothetical protein
MPIYGYPLGTRVPASPDPSADPREENALYPYDHRAQLQLAREHAQRLARDYARAARASEDAVRAARRGHVPARASRRPARA